MNILRSSIPLIVFLSTHTVAFGQPDSPKNDRSQWLKQVFHDVAASYEITAGAGRELKRIPLRDEPITHWLSGDGTNRIYVDSVFVWTRQQRRPFACSLSIKRHSHKGMSGFD